ncbi:MAG: hypothetical protein GWO20_00935 [Candidatus Korarchaeota archaeon]|nr:hypothetical protein [Candidatus Korarchaeota archaeon]NIU82857.1 hypothetical protein [Candidatus Thorarchaeota archaeon]NIW12551.1 hypothetical protein [Candidatus Thorarchaeota archaeon]NIW50771.1 hypothetical protein [Candidatus Korarchaeota archaeon]
MEDVDIWFQCPYDSSPQLNFFIAGTWSKYTETLDDFEAELINLTNEFDEFNYSLGEDSGEQRIDLTLDYMEEKEKTCGRLYTVHEEHLIDYDDFLLEEYTRNEVKEIVEIKNEDYLTGIEGPITLKKEYTESTRYQDFLSKYGLWIGIGGVGAVIAIITIIWKKKTKK